MAADGTGLALVSFRLRCPLLTFDLAKLGSAMDLRSIFIHLPFEKSKRATTDSPILQYSLQHEL